MATLLEKAHTLASASIPAMLDQALKTYSLVVLDEYIRHAQNSLDDLNDAANTIGGQVKTLKQKTSEFDQRAQDLDQDVDLFLLRGSQDLAVSAQHKLNHVQEMAQEYRDHYQNQHREYQNILDARLLLEAKLTAIRQEREQIQALLESASASQTATEALSAGEDLARAQDPNIARMANSIRSRLDSTGARNRAGTIPMDERVDRLLSSTEIEIQLWERKHRLGISSHDQPAQ